MITVTLKDVLDYNLPEDYGAGVYVWIADDGDILYVGKASSFGERFEGHLGLDHRKSKSPIGRAAIENMPASLGWTIQLYNAEDCKEFYPPALLAAAIYHPPHPSLIIEMAELALITKLVPKLNTIDSPGRAKKPRPTGYAHSDVSSADYLDF